jgi:hypothetical protein
LSWIEDLLFHQFHKISTLPVGINGSDCSFISEILFDSSNAVLGMAFMHTHTPLEKVIAFCTAETNFVLHSKQNKNKDSRTESRLETSKVVKKGGKKSTQNLKKAGKSHLASVGFRGLPRASSAFNIMQ